jgi:hypothetical protein
MIPPHICSMCIKTNQVGKQEVGIWWVQKRFPRYGVPIWSLWPYIRFLPSITAEKIVTKCGYMYMFNVYKNQPSRQTGSRNLMGPKTLPTIWGTSSYRYTILWVAFLDLSDSYFLFLYSLNIHVYAHFSSHFSQQLLMAEIWYLVTIFILVRNIVGGVFGSVRFLLPGKMCIYMYVQWV